MSSEQWFINHYKVNSVYVILWLPISLQFNTNHQVKFRHTQKVNTFKLPWLSTSQWVNINIGEKSHFQLY